MPRPLPFSVRVLALSHARAWPTAAWTGVATAVGAGLTLGLSEWAVLAALTVVCGGAVRLTTAHLVEAWVAMRPGASPTVPAPTSEYDAAAVAALRAFTRVSLVPPTPR